MRVAVWEKRRWSEVKSGDVIRLQILDKRFRVERIRRRIFKRHLMVVRIRALEGIPMVGVIEAVSDRGVYVMESEAGD